LPGYDVIQLQTEQLLRAQGASNEGVKLTLDLFGEVFTILKGKDDPATAEKQIREMLATKTAAMTEEQRKGMAQILKTIDTQLQQFYLTEWFRFFLRYDPRPTLKKVQVPVLAINGEKDLQVPYKENLAGIEAALKEGGNKDYTVVHMAQLNHLFQTSNTGLIAEYGDIEETISSLALKTMSDWILKHTTQANTATNAN